MLSKGYTYIQGILLRFIGFLRYEREMTKSSTSLAVVQENDDDEESNVSFASICPGFGQLSLVHDRPLQIRKSLSRSNCDVI